MVHFPSQPGDKAHTIALSPDILAAAKKVEA